MRIQRICGVVLASVALATLSGCAREVRAFHPSDPFRETADTSKEEKNAYALSEGKRLYVSFNCAVCHGGAGGGAMGPPLMDERWLYGSRPSDIYETIANGRPNGMPAFGKKIPPQQIRQLVAYVRSLSAWTASDATPGRSDHMNVGPPENSRKEQTPEKDADPPYSEKPK